MFLVYFNIFYTFILLNVIYDIKYTATNRTCTTLQYEPEQLREKGPVIEKDFQNLSMERDGITTILHRHVGNRGHTIRKKYNMT